jgi:ribosome-binding ATPase YchF (GTP1/OBG family)
VVDSCSVREGTTVPEGAGIVHTDFEKRYILAKIINFEDFIQYKGEVGAKEAGK